MNKNQKRVKMIFGANKGGNYIKYRFMNSYDKPAPAVMRHYVNPVLYYGDCLQIDNLNLDCKEENQYHEVSYKKHNTKSLKVVLSSWKYYGFQN